MNLKKIKVLIIEDAMTSPKLVKEMIESDPMLEIIGIARGENEALKMIAENRPDVITLEFSIPTMDEFEITKRILSNYPIPILIINPKCKADDADFSFRALECGALGIVEKPTGVEDLNFSLLAYNMIKTIKLVSEIRPVARRYPSPLSRHFACLEKIPVKRQKIEAIAIGASIGGPLALKEVLSNIARDCPVPIFIVQHIMDGFLEGFAYWLSAFSKLPIIIPKEEEPILPGHVYIAPDFVDMIIQENQTIHLCGEESVKGIKPSVAKLFESVISVYKNHAIGILLTGMGEDGSKELLYMKKCGAVTIVQDENSSLVFGMPGRAVEYGAAQYILPLEEIAPFLNEYTKPAE